MTTSIFIIGAGGHTKVLLDTLLNDRSVVILGILDKDARLHGKSIFNVPVVGCEDEILKKYHTSDIKLVNGIGSVGIADLRKTIFQRFKKSGYSFLTVSHATAYAAHHVIVDEGSQLMAGSIVQPSSRIGKNVIVNTNACVDHDCVIGDHVHLAPSVTCCGNVTIGEGTHVGSGAVIRQGIKIASNCLIAAGAMVIHDIVDGSRVAGVPAKIMS